MSLIVPIFSKTILTTQIYFTYNIKTLATQHITTTPNVHNFKLLNEIGSSQITCYVPSMVYALNWH